MSEDWVTTPLVSGLMVFDRPQQLAAARASVNCFFEQRWPHKELVIFNATQHRLSPGWWRKRFCTEIALRRRSPEQMLELALENSIGEWCLNWLPDCWYHPDYLEHHLKRRAKNRIVLFRHARIYSLKDHKMVIANGGVPSWSFYRYFPVNMQTSLSEQFEDILRLNNPAHLLVKFAREIL